MAAFAIAVSIWLRNRAVGTLEIVMAAVLAVARVAVGVHYPSDGIAGALIGTGSALVLWLPPIRRPLHQLAELIGSLYERILDRLFRRQPAAS